MTNKDQDLRWLVIWSLICGLSFAVVIICGVVGGLIYRFAS